MSALGDGYYLVENGNVSILGAYKEETDAIKKALESGVYYQ